MVQLQQSLLAQVQQLAQAGAAVDALLAHSHTTAQQSAMQEEEEEDEAHRRAEDALAAATAVQVALDAIKTGIAYCRDKAAGPQAIADPPSMASLKVMSEPMTTAQYEKAKACFDACYVLNKPGTSISSAEMLSTLLKTGLVTSVMFPNNKQLNKWMRVRFAGEIQRGDVREIMPHGKHAWKGFARLHARLPAEL